MALRDASGVYYTMVCFVENGKTTWRKMHQLMVQARDGRLHTLRGKHLPDTFVFNTGISQSDEHLGEMLGLPREGGPSSLGSFVPGPRDWVYVIVGAALVVILKASLILATTTY